MKKPERQPLFFWGTMPLLKKIFFHTLQDHCGKMPRHLYTTLLCVHFNGKQRMSEISERLGLSKPLITQHVDKLVADGFFRRVDDPADRRIVFIEMTAKGSKYAQEVAEYFLNKGTAALNVLSRSDIAKFSGCIRTLSELLAKIDASSRKAEA